MKGFSGFTVLDVVGCLGYREFLMKLHELDIKSMVFDIKSRFDKKYLGYWES